MKNITKIFGKILRANFKFAVVVAASCTMAGAYGAIDKTGCENEDNVYITPELALCSTHVYNIGDNKNPEDDSTRQLMRDVVALKTTVITQQMYVQYEFLESMLKRLKTQLEKEVLLAKLEASGATPRGDSTGASASTSNDKNIVLIGAKNCQLETSGTTAVLKCLQNNINVVLNALSAGNVGEARRQLLKDLDVAQTWGAVANVNKKYRGFIDGAQDNNNWSSMTACDAIQSSRDNVSQCAYSLNAAISKKIEAMSRQQSSPQK